MVIIIEALVSFKVTSSDIYAWSSTLVPSLNVQLGRNTREIVKKLLAQGGCSWNVMRLLNKNYRSASRRKLEVHVQQKHELGLNVQCPLYRMRNSMLRTLRAHKENKMLKTMMLPNRSRVENCLRHVPTPFTVETC